MNPFFKGVCTTNSLEGLFHENLLNSLTNVCREIIMKHTWELDVPMNKGKGCVFDMDSGAESYPDNFISRKQMLVWVDVRVIGFF